MLIITDHFSKWPEIIPLKKASAKVIADNLFDNYISRYEARVTTRGLLATDHVILNHGQVTWTTPELAPPLLTTTPHQRENVSALDRFNVHRCPTRRVFSDTALELVTRQATIRYLYHSATAATGKTPAELFLGRKLVTPFQKLVIGIGRKRVSSRRYIEELFDEARRNTKAKHENWAKYYNKRRRDVRIQSNVTGVGSDTSFNFSSEKSSC
ncbi:uncharacterized protein TNCV_3306831 [Trichonephila clavipes]|nr:uncharacterized protein TNCV_3306831 [Trichonephila clavipes]